MSTPNVENYVLGRGSLFWDPWDPIAKAYAGERHLGNAPEVSVNMNVSFLDHFSSMSGFKAKDKTTISEISPQISFTLDELDSENWKLLVFGDSSVINQSASDALSLVVAAPIKGRTYDLSARSIAAKRLNHGAVTGTFAVAETVTGGTSAATGVIVQKVDTITEKYLILETVTGTFASGETITGGTSTATATTSSAVVGVPGAVTVKSTVGSTYYTQNIDFTVDANSGQLLITGASTISGSITILYGCAATTYTVITSLTNIGQEGKLRFTSDNPEGGQYELTAWRVRVKPNGDTALIGDDWAKMQFQGDILRDVQYHPTSPFMNLIVTDAV